MEARHTENDKIYIIGAGAIGKALAVFLKRENKQVILIRGSVDHLPSEEHEITVLGKNETFKECITTTTFSNLSVIDGIVLVATKTFANAQIAKKLSEFKGNFPIVLLQNGLHVERPFKTFDKVYRCVLFTTSQITGDNEVTFKAVIASPIGNLEGKNEVLEELIAQINTNSLTFRSEPDIVEYIWSKAIANAVFNTICPLLETDNGIFHRNPRAKQIAKTIIDECVSLAKLKGVHLDVENLLENVLLISQKSEGQLISTYVDILNKRQTEIESLNLEIANVANEIGQPELVSKTQMLGQLIQVKSSLNSNS